MALESVSSPTIKFVHWTWLTLFLTPHLLTIAASQVTIKTLPGFNGTLPFKLETGYVSVGKSDDVELFYYFVESEKDPGNDPLLLWLTGGPGCSSFTGLVYENGPLSFDFTANDGGLPSFVLNPYSWTKIASIIYLDTPVGSGFSYASTSEGYYSSNTKSAADTYAFLRKWLMDHPKFVKNPLYICGDSYAGIYVPMVVLEISKGNEAGYMPYMPLQGYVLGNPITNYYAERNSRIQYAHRTALISDEYYKAARRSCNGEYVNPDPNNAQCIKYLRLIDECTARVNREHILENCVVVDIQNSNELKGGHRYLKDVSMDIPLPPSIGEVKCWVKMYDLSNTWANDSSVQQALHIRNGTKTEWTRCNWSISYEMDIPNVVEYHRTLSKKDYRALIYSGDHDLTAPYIATLSWISSLNLTTEEDWRPWYVGDQNAGFTEKYKKNGYDLTFATVKGAGHIAIDYKPMECYAMVERWFSKSQL